MQLSFIVIFIIFFYSHGLEIQLNNVTSTILRENVTLGNRRQQITTFLYFAYGLCLRHQWLKATASSAQFISTSILTDYRLDFVTYDPNWKGARATIIKEKGSIVYGAVFEIANDEMDKLSSSEGVTSNLYRLTGLDVKVTAYPQVTHLAYAYIQNAYAEKILKNEEIPMDRRPSDTYLQVLILGAIESQLPSDYVRYLYKYKTTGEQATVEIRRKLGYPFLTIYD